MKQTYKSKLIETQDPEGAIIVDDDRFPIALGGIRLLRGTTQRELELLATTMSYKLHSYGMPMSGAKAGINSDRIEDFYDFITKPQIKSLINGTADTKFIGGPDMGTTEEEYLEALKGADIGNETRSGLLAQKSDKYEIPFNNIITAYGVIVAAEELMKLDVPKGDDPLASKSFVLEGFGKVGTGIAKLLQGRSEIRAVSTRFGCIIADDPTAGIVEGKGFDIEKLLELQKEHDEDFIYHTGLEVYPVEKLFDVACDVLVPAAETESLDIDICKRITKSRPSYIIPVANYPYTQDGLELLAKAKISAFPDFLVSVGAVLGSVVEFAGVGGQAEAMDLVDSAVRSKTKDLITGIKACGDNTKTMYQLAVENADKAREQLANNLDDYNDIVSISQKVIKDYLPSLMD